MFVLFAYGRATYLAGLADADDETLGALAFHPQGVSTPAEGDVVKLLVSEAVRAKEVIEAALSPHAPSEWGFGMTDRMYAQLAEVIEIRRSRGALYLEELTMRLTVDSFAGHYFPCPEPAPLAFTWNLPLASALEDMVHQGLLLGCEYLITNDPQLTGGDGRRTFRSPAGPQIIAITLLAFAEDELNDSDFSLSEIRNAGELLIQLVPSGLG
jgi:hypothetical protein